MGSKKATKKRQWKWDCDNRFGGMHLYEDIEQSGGNIENNDGESRNEPQETSVKVCFYDSFVVHT